VQAMLRAESKKTLVLAEDIKDNGLNPAERLIVTPGDDPLRFIVLDGNRRLTSLRILAEPSIASAVLKTPTMKKLQRWSADYIKDPLQEIDCIIFDTREEANLWIERRHQGESSGAGVVAWGPIEQRRFEARATGQKRPDLQAFDLVAEKGKLDEATREKLHDFPITNLERLIEDEAVRKRIGLELDENGQLLSKLPLEEVLKPLARMVRDIANKTIKVDSIYTAQQRGEYLDRFKRSELPNLGVAGSASKPIVSGPPAAAPASAPGARGRAGRSRLRVSVVHPQCRLSIKSARIDKVFRELRDLRVDSFANTVAIMLRVFLEFTVDHYFEEQSLPQLPKGKDTLAAKLSVVAGDLTSRGVMTKGQVKGIEYAAREKRVVGANITTFNAFVHNKDFAPMAVDLRAYWDNLQLFFETVWAK
jgi:hypothetical protein